MARTTTKECRESPRTQISLLVKVLTSNEWAPMEFETVDVSEGGVFLATDSPFPILTEVIVQFRLDSLNATVHASGIVVRSSDEPSETGGRAGMAIQFEGPGWLGWQAVLGLL